MQNTIKFAVTRVVGDDETILKLFKETQLEEARAYGKQAAHNYNTGLITLFKAAFAPDGTRADDRFRLYDCYRCGK